jgi:hypothetical protein
MNSYEINCGNGNNHFRCNIILSDFFNGFGFDGIVLDDEFYHEFHNPFLPIVYFTQVC